MRAKVIVDNIASHGISGEWGLSIYLEYMESKILLDVGSTNLFADNADKLGVHIKAVDYAVLSHAHYDHSGGMEKFFEINNHARFYLRDSAQCYFKKYIFRKYIGIPKNIIERYSDRIVFVSGDYNLCEGVYLIPHHTKGLEKIGKREMMYQRTASGWKPDDFSHEQSLVFDTEKGLVIFNSCSHGGVIHIIDEVSRVFPDKSVYGLIGGFHLYNKKENEIRELAGRIKETGIKYVCTGHCTKDRAYEILKTELGDVIHQLHVGLEMEF